MKSRREFLKMGLMGGAFAFASPAVLYGSRNNEFVSFFAGPAGPQDAWEEVRRILSRIKPPVFPERDFDITKFGAVGDNNADCTEAFQKAIAACSQAGGGRVIVPKGEFLTGAIHLKSNVNLHVNSGAIIRFTRDTRMYPLVFTRWEGVGLMNYSPFIYAFEQENIAITGEGIIDGQSDCEHWWPWKGRTKCGPPAGGPDQTKDRNLLFKMAERGAPVRERIFGEGHYLRPQFVQPYRCKNVLLEGVTLRNSPMWQVHPVLCSNVTVRKLTISSAGPNTDGCDPESSKDVLIEECFFDTGDDCIAIKSGRNADGRRLNTPSENLIVRGCRMKNGHGGVTVGSEISGGVRNIFAENCQMDSPDLDCAVRIKNNAMRGGTIEKIYVRNINVGRVAQAAVSIDFNYEEGAAGKFTPVVHDVEIRHLNTQKAQYAFYLRGFKQAPITDVTIADCDFEGVAKPNIVENVKDMTLQNVRINGKPVDQVI